MDLHLLWIKISNRFLHKWCKDKCLQMQVKVYPHKWWQGKWDNKDLILQEPLNITQVKTLLFNNIPVKSLHKVCTLLQWDQGANSKEAYHNSKCRQYLLVMVYLHSFNKALFLTPIYPPITCLQSNKIRIHTHLITEWTIQIWWLCNSSKVKFKSLIRQFNNMWETYNWKKQSWQEYKLKCKVRVITIYRKTMRLFSEERPLKISWVS